MISGIDSIVMFGASALAGTLLISSIYIVLAVIAFRLVPANAPWQYLVLVGAILTPVLAIYGSVASIQLFPIAPSNLGVWFTIAGILVSVIWTLASKTNLELIKGLEPVES